MYGQVTRRRFGLLEVVRLMTLKGLCHDERRGVAADYVNKQGVKMVIAGKAWATADRETRDGGDAEGEDDQNRTTRRYIIIVCF